MSNSASLFLLGSALLHAAMLAALGSVPLLSAGSGDVGTDLNETGIIEVSLVPAMKTVTAAVPAAVSIPSLHLPSSPHALAEKSRPASDSAADTIGLLNYLPASQLTERPIVVNDIDPVLSERFSGVTAQSMTLVLLINEYGDVDQVLFDEASATGHLPDTLKEDLRQRFLEARFRPGHLHGQPVRSLLAIAVDLHSAAQRHQRHY